MIADCMDLVLSMWRGNVIVRGMSRCSYACYGNPAVCRVFVVLCIFVMAVRVMGQGARMAGDDLPPAPQSHVLDDAELFREQPEKLATIKAKLAAMEGKYAYPVYLAVYYSVYDGDLQGRAEALRKAWIGEKARGMVIVYQLDPVVSGDNPSIAYYHGSELQSDLSGSEKLQLISGNEVDAMLARVLAEVKADDSEDIAFLDGLVAGLEGEIDRYHEVKPTRWTDRWCFPCWGCCAGSGLSGRMRSPARCIISRR